MQDTQQGQVLPVPVPCLQAYHAALFQRLCTSKLTVALHKVSHEAAAGS